MPAECYNLTALMAVLLSLSDHRCECSALHCFENSLVLNGSPKWSREMCHMRHVLITMECQMRFLYLCGHKMLRVARGIHFIFLKLFTPPSLSHPFIHPILPSSGLSLVIMHSESSANRLVKS